MTEQEPIGREVPAGPATEPGDLEQIVDDIEDRVLGHSVDQERHEDDAPDEPAFTQDLDSDEGQDASPSTGAGAEPTS
ncbi:MAG TPA: hypothetical protein VIQ30_12250 [Pseudonocardia sp.]|jgi:hypothetical protein